MKKLLVYFVLLFSILSFAKGQQRLAVLPELLRATGDLTQASTLCIDYFKAVPKTHESLSFIDGDASQSNTTILGENTYNRAHVKSGHSKIQSVAYFGTANADKNIPKYYKQFIEDRTNFYAEQVKSQRLTKSKARAQLQADVWEFNIQDNLGYLNKNMDPTTAVAAFSDARKRFKEVYKDKWGPDASALYFGDELTTMAATNYELQYVSHAKYNNFFVHFEKGTNKYCVFDSEGHIISTCDDSQQAIASMLSSAEAAPNETIYVTPLNFPNDARKDAFITNANLAGFKGGDRISFQSYYHQDVIMGAQRYSIPRRYNVNEITTAEIDNKTYNFFESHFQARTKYYFSSEVEVDAYSTSVPILSELINKINSAFPVRHVIDNAKQNISLASFLYQFKKKVKQIHGLQSEDELKIIIQYQLSPIGVVKIQIQKLKGHSLSIIFS